MATWRFDFIKNCLTLNIAFKTSANTVSVNTFLSYSKCSVCLPPAFTILSQHLSKTRDSCGKFSHVFLQCNFYFIWLRIKLPKMLCVLTWNLQRVRIWRVRWALLYLNPAWLSDTCCVRRAMHLDEYTAPSGSSRLQSSIKLGSRNQSINHCLQKRCL